MKTQVSNEFILEAHKEACSTWKARIEKECPELFKKTLEVGKWYKGHVDFNSLIYITDIELNYGYKNANRIHYFGFTFGRFEQEGGMCNIDHEKSLVLATEQEVKEALINEAKKRGFVHGVRIKECLEGGDFNSKLKDEFTFGCDNDLWIDSYTRGSNVCIFKDGTWAEIVKEPTEIELIKAEIEKLNERLNKLL